MEAQTNSSDSEQNLSEPSSSSRTAENTERDSSRGQQNVDLLIEANRLATFRNWPNPNISPESLAKAGFFYLNRYDEVKCAWCKGVFAQWEKCDNAFEEHKRFFPECPKVQLGPLIEMASNGIRDLGIYQILVPRKPAFSSLDARLRTYTNWPIRDVQRPEALAQAGLYFTNVDDQVRCFQCNIGLHSWEKADDPWFEHAKWFPSCEFVKLVKGAGFIEEVQDKTLRQTLQSRGIMTIDEAMATPPVLKALELQIGVGYLRNVTQKRLLSEGRPYDTVEELVRAVFDDLKNDDASSDTMDVNNDLEAAGTSTSRNIFNSNVLSGTDAIAVTNNIDFTRNKDNTDKLSNATNVTNQTDAVDCHNTTDTRNTAADKETQISTNQCLSLEEENRKLRDARLCKVCLDEEVGVVFLPCGHLVTCVQCAPGITQCPMCRTAIKGFVRTFLS